MIVDVLAVSLGFVLRAVAGAVAVAVHISEWLLVCTILLALFLTLAKRRHELTSLNQGASDHRKILAEYSPYLLDQMISVVTASCVTAYAFYTTAADTREKFQTDRLVWTCPSCCTGSSAIFTSCIRRRRAAAPRTSCSRTARCCWPWGCGRSPWSLIVYTASGTPVPLGR